MSIATRSTIPGILTGALAAGGAVAAPALAAHTRLPLVACALLASAPFGAAVLAWARAQRRGQRAAEGAPAPRLLSRRDLPGLGLLLGLVCALLHPVLLGGEGLVPVDAIGLYEPWSSQMGARPSNLLLADQYLELLPQQQFAHAWLSRGELPLWNPHLACGVPFLASMQAAPLFPVNLLLAPLDPFASRGPAALIKLWLAGFFTYLYLRRLGGSRAAATLSAVAFAFSGFMVVWLGHPHTNAALWLPLLLFLIEGGLSSAGGRRWRSWIGLALAIAAVWLGGHPPTAVHVTAVAAIYFAFRWAGERGEDRRRGHALAFAGALACGGLLAAVQIVPFLEYYAQSSAPLASAALDRSASHLPPVALVHLLLPYLSGSPALGFGHLAADLGLAREHNFHAYTGFVGVVTLYLAVLALLLRRDRLVLFHALLAAGCLAIVLGVPPLPWLLGSLPVLRDMAHTRLLLVVGFSLAVLGGLGLDRLGRPEGEKRRLAALVVWWLGAAVLLAGVWVALRPSLRAELAVAFTLRQYAVFLAALAFVSLVSQMNAGRRLATLACVAAASAEMLWFASGYNPTADRAHYYPETPGIAVLTGDRSVFRLLGLGAVFPPDTPMVFGLDDARGRDFMGVRRYEELIRGQAGDFQFLRTLPDLPAAVLALNVKYVVTAGGAPFRAGFPEPVYRNGIAIYRMEPYVERALVVRPFEVEDAGAVLARMREGAFDPRRVLLLEEEPGAPAASAGSAAPADAVRITAYEPDGVSLEASLAEPGFVLLLDTWFPGWRVSVDGRDRPLLRADYNFRAVRLGAGTWRVRFDYRPASFALGATLSLMTASGLAALWLTDPVRGARVAATAARNAPPAA